MSENSSQAEFDSGFLSSQQPLRFAALSTSPYTGEAFTRGIYTSHYQHNSILFCFLGCGFALPPPYTGEAFTSSISTCIINHYQPIFNISKISDQHVFVIHTSSNSSSCAAESHFIVDKKFLRTHPPEGTETLFFILFSVNSFLLGRGNIFPRIHKTAAAVRNYAPPRSKIHPNRSHKFLLTVRAIIRSRSSSDAALFLRNAPQRVQRCVMI